MAPTKRKGACAGPLRRSRFGLLHICCLLFEPHAGRNPVVEKTITFELQPDTKNTYRFQEVVKGEPPLIGTLYVQRWAFETKPQTITVTIKA